MCGTWTDLGEAAGSQRIGVNRVQIDPGRWSTPVHRELDAEEIFFVLRGSGLSWQNGKTHEVGASDCIVHRVAEEHTFRAGDDGLDMLAFGERIIARYTHFPRTHVIGNYRGRGDLRHPRGTGHAGALALSHRPGEGARTGGASDPRRARDLAAGEQRDLSSFPSRPGRDDVPCLRDEGAQRRLLLPSLEQDLLARPGSDRTPRAPLVPRRGARGVTEE
jgi:uncharacterized cupin superfamily protein